MRVIRDSDDENSERAVARDSDPETSWEAARSVKDLRKSQLEVLTLFTRPLTDETMIELAFARGIIQSESGLRTRRKELVNKGLLVWTGEFGSTVNGRRTRIWGRP